MCMCFLGAVAQQIYKSLLTLASLISAIFNILPVVYHKSCSGIQDFLLLTEKALVKLKLSNMIDFRLILSTKKIKDFSFTRVIWNMAIP